MIGRGAAKQISRARKWHFEGGHTVGRGVSSTHFVTAGPKALKRIRTAAEMNQMEQVYDVITKRPVYKESQLL